MARKNEEDTTKYGRHTFFTSCILIHTQQSLGEGQAHHYCLSVILRVRVFALHPGIIFNIDNSSDPVAPLWA